MKTVLGKIRRCDEEYHLFAPGDRVAIGVSGGKDSMLLLKALSLYRYVRHGDFSLQAITLTSGKEKPDTSALEAYAAEVGVPIHIEHTDIYEILFDIRKDNHPCALCAKMRRSILCQRAQQLGCSKLALAHNREDVLETFLMSLIFEGRLHTFHPKTLMSKTGVTVIRPMVYVPERHVIHMQRELELPILKNPCPANGYTKREEMKQSDLRAGPPLSHAGRKYAGRASQLQAVRAVGAGGGRKLRNAILSMKTQYSHGNVNTAFLQKAHFL